MLTLKGKEYFFIVETLAVDDDKEFITKTRRGIHYNDCGLRLKTSEKKIIKRHINSLF